MTTSSRLETGVDKPTYQRPIASSALTLLVERQDRAFGL